MIAKVIVLVLTGFDEALLILVLEFRGHYDNHIHQGKYDSRCNAARNLYCGQEIFLSLRSLRTELASRLLYMKDRRQPGPDAIRLIRNNYNIGRWQFSLTPRRS